MAYFAEKIQQRNFRDTRKIHINTPFLRVGLQGHFFEKTKNHSCI